jgi:methionyl-tRNA synthetase
VLTHTSPPSDFGDKQGMVEGKYYVTAPVYDPAFPGIGSLYSAILSDAIARHRRASGFDVAHFGGASTGGGNAKCSEEGSRAERVVSAHRSYGRFDDLAALADIGHTHFGNPSSAEHIHAVQAPAASDHRPLAPCDI